ncbi:MAG: Coenzyme F420 hydrogenase/dehydrogenase, beta subunit C-terminal domain [Candidatus Fermentibacteria bacterium]
MADNDIKTFKNLKAEVIDTGLCGRCGGCVSVCSASGCGALKLGDSGVPEYVEPNICMDGGLCYLVCPWTDALKEELKARADWVQPIGHFSDILSARSTDADIRKAATDGGVVTALLVQMLKAGHIDGAVVSVNTDMFNRKAIVATSKEELLNAAGSHFSELPHLEEVGEKYSGFVSIVKQINQFKQVKKFRKLAVVGTPCQITAIKKMQAISIVPSDIIKFTVGLFCMQCFEMDSLMDKDFIKNRQIRPEDISSVNVKKDFIFNMKSGIQIYIPMNEVEKIARPACLRCSHFANDFADISVGGLGSPDGYTTVMVRTIEGKKRFADALAGGSIELISGMTEDDRKADRLGKIALIKEFTARKQARAVSYNERPE